MPLTDHFIDRLRAQSLGERRQWTLGVREKIGHDRFS
jgi:hypothetical protein